MHRTHWDKTLLKSLDLRRRTHAHAHARQSRSKSNNLRAESRLSSRCARAARQARARAFAVVNLARTSFPSRRSRSLRNSWKLLFDWRRKIDCPFPTCARTLPCIGAWSFAGHEKRPGGLKMEPYAAHSDVFSNRLSAYVRLCQPAHEQQASTRDHFITARSATLHNSTVYNTKRVCSKQQHRKRMELSLDGDWKWTETQTASETQSYSVTLPQLLCFRQNINDQTCGCNTDAELASRATHPIRRCLGVRREILVISVVNKTLLLQNNRTHRWQTQSTAKEKF